MTEDVLEQLEKFEATHPDNLSEAVSTEMPFMWKVVIGGLILIIVLCLSGLAGISVVALRQRDKTDKANNGQRAALAIANDRQAQIELLLARLATVPPGSAEDKIVRAQLQDLQNQVQHAIGPSGPAGPIGAQGTKGDKGDKGDPGPQGATGPEGPIGPKGDPGADGAGGASGSNGANGTPGATGSPGATGAPGSQGPPNTSPQEFRHPDGSVDTCVWDGTKYVCNQTTPPTTTTTTTRPPTTTTSSTILPPILP